MTTTQWAGLTMLLPLIVISIISMVSLYIGIDWQKQIKNGLITIGIIGYLIVAVIFLEGRI